MAVRWDLEWLIYKDCSQTKVASRKVLAHIVLYFIIWTLRVIYVDSKHMETFLGYSFNVFLFLGSNETVDSGDMWI